ncbi:MADS-box domain-containing protein [Mycena kentingensis (nom. inval.)]|nr:MADS-box domain-containing protein [Mycena kentingensis (nom. inval.)]
MLVVLKSDSQGVPERPRDFPVPTLPPGEVYLDENHVRPGLAMNQGQYDTAKDIVLDLLGWGVPPDYLVDCNLSREIIFYVFSELNLRLPPNLDVTGLVQYTPSIVAKHSRSLLNRPSDASSRPTLPDKPSAGTTSPAPPSPPASASTLHDIERQRREELLARKAVQASRKTKVSDDSAAPDQDVEMPTVPVANEAVDDFLKSIGDTSASPEVKPEPTDAMDVDDVILAAGGSVGSPSNGAATPDLAIQSEPTDSPPPTDEAADAQVPKKRASRRGTKRPTAADFVDIDTGSRNGHRGAVPPMKRKSASFASVSGQRKLVIDLSDSEGGDEPMPDAETDGGSGYASPAPGRGLATPPVAPASLVEKEEQIRKMKDLIAQREKSRLQKTLTRSTPAESVRDDTIKDSVPQSAIAATPQADTEVPAASTEDSTMPGKDATIGQDTQEPVAVEVESASSSAQRQTPTTIPVHPKRDASPREERKFEHYAPYSSLLSSYPHLLATASRFSSSNPSLSSSSSIPCAPSSSISSLPSASSAAVPLPSLKPLRLATATKRVCQYEVPGGGTCRDAGCEDIHLGQMGSLEPSDSETVEYVARLNASIPNHSHRDTTPTMRKRQRTSLEELPQEPIDDPGNNFIADDVESGDDDDDDKPKGGQKQGRRKIKIEFIQDKSRRHITFSKRKAGIMKKAYELSTLTGTQVLLLVVSETGLVYTFTTAKLQPLVTQPEGKNLIQACLNAPHGTLPSSMPVGQPIGRSSGPGGSPSSNIPGGLSISGGPPNSSSKEDDEPGDEDEPHPSAGAPASNTRTATSPHANAPPPLSIPSGSPTSPQQTHAPSATSPAQYSAGGTYHHPQHQAHDAGGQMQAALPPRRVPPADSNWVVLPLPPRINSTGRRMRKDRYKVVGTTGDEMHSPREHDTIFHARPCSLALAVTYNYCPLGRSLSVFSLA